MAFIGCGSGGMLDFLPNSIVGLLGASGGVWRFLGGIFVEFGQYVWCAKCNQYCRCQGGGLRVCSVVDVWCFGVCHLGRKVTVADWGAS